MVEMAAAQFEESDASDDMDVKENAELGPPQSSSDDDLLLTVGHLSYQAFGNSAARNSPNGEAIKTGAECNHPSNKCDGVTRIGSEDTAQLDNVAELSDISAWKNASPNSSADIKNSHSHPTVKCVKPSEVVIEPSLDGIKDSQSSNVDITDNSSQTVEDSQPSDVRVEMDLSVSTVKSAESNNVGCPDRPSHQRVGHAEHTGIIVERNTSGSAAKNNSSSNTAITDGPSQQTVQGTETSLISTLLNTSTNAKGSKPSSVDDNADCVSHQRITDRPGVRGTKHNNGKGKKTLKRKTASSSGRSSKVRRNVLEPKAESVDESNFHNVNSSKTRKRAVSETVSSKPKQSSLNCKGKRSITTSRSSRTRSRTAKVEMTEEQSRSSSEEREMVVGERSKDTASFQKLVMSSSSAVETGSRDADTEAIKDKGVPTTTAVVTEPAMSEADSDEELLDPSLSLDEEEYEVGDLVWAKHPYTLFWPALVKEVVPGRQTKITVDYFNAGGDLFRCQYSIRAIRKFSLENKRIMREGNQSEQSAAFKIAVQEAMEYLEKRALASSPTRDPLASPIHCQSFDSPPLTPTEGIPNPLGPSCSTPGGYESPPSPEMVVGGVESIPEPVDLEKEAEKLKKKQKWSKIEDRLIRYIKKDETKERLLKIWRGKIKSKRHDSFFSSSLKERDRLKFKAQLGPLITDEKIDEVTDHLHNIYREHCQKETEILPNTAYIFDVWLPEAILHAVCRSRGVGQEKADQILALEGLQVCRDLDLL